MDSEMMVVLASSFAYGAAGYPIARYVGGQQAWNDAAPSATKLRPNNAAWGGFCAFVVVLIWPLFAFGWWWNRNAEKVLYKPPEVVERQKKERLKAIDARVKLLEKENPGWDE